ncbi:MAG: DUF4249 family protein, partial [Bacteroidales bacterium]|nr:DUF4249 family protein [Bacteroidales bacterium]
MKRLLLCMGIALFCSCVKEEIDANQLSIPKTYEIATEVIVEGYLTDEMSIQLVKLSKPAKIDDSCTFIPINTAEVFVTNGDTTYWYNVLGNDGIYQSHVPFKAESGKVYTLHILYNNKKYTASDSMNTTDSIINYPIKSVRVGGSHIEIHSQEHNFGFLKPAIWTFIERRLDSLQRFPHIEIDFFHTRFFLLYNHTGSLPQGLFPSSFSSTLVSGAETDSLEIVKLSISDSYYNYLISYFNITDWNSG